MKGLFPTIPNLHIAEAIVSRADREVFPSGNSVNKLPLWDAGKQTVLFAKGKVCKLIMQTDYIYCEW